MAAATDAGIAIRAAEEGDVEAIASLCGQLGYPAGADEMRMRYVRIRTTQAGEILVAVRSTDAAVVGWTHVVPRPQLEDAAFAELAGFVVDASARSAGVGAALLAAAEDWARRQGLATMRVRSNVIRERAHRFYEREGYARCKVQAVFRKVL
jgi:GNAT superfamily N-acetyltransferase